MKLGVSVFLYIYLHSVFAFSNPYHKENLVPVDSDYINFEVQNYQDYEDWSENHSLKSGLKVIKFQFDWNQNQESFSLTRASIENSGTEALYRRTKINDKLGSYKLVAETQNGKLKYNATIGTGTEYRKLTRALTFRIPYTTSPLKVTLYAEHPKSGKMIVAYQNTVNPKSFRLEPIQNIQVKLIRPAKASPALKVNIYAEGFYESEKDNFLNSAKKVVVGLENSNLPMTEHFEFHAVFAPSSERLGSARNLGLPVPEKKTFLGLYYPYWDNFGRWYHVLYPTRESKYRNGIGQVAYDYPIVVVNSTSYWGVGNYMSHTAIPAYNRSFVYLLLHEFGHFLGLNEEYEGGGRTELEFAPDIYEPWSQNITFLRYPDSLKWRKLVDKDTPIPTPRTIWRSSPANYGAYKGGYADSKTGHSHKPGFDCVMHRAPGFCDICKDAVQIKVKYDLGM